MKKVLQEKLFCHIFHILAVLMFAVLFYYCLGITGENSGELSDEYIYFKTDAVLLNVLGICAALPVLFFIGKLSEFLKSRKVRNIVLAVVCVLSALIGFLWVYATRTAPQSDQLCICQYADAFNRGDYSKVGKGEYIVNYPYQLGIITFMRVVFTLFGEGNYRAFQYLSAALLPLLVLSGCKIVRILSDENVRVELYYLLFILFCFPMYAYTSFVYGDLLSIIFGMTASWMFLACLKRFSWWRMALMGICMGLAVQLRAGMMVLVIALVITAGGRILTKRKWETIVLPGALLLGVFAMQLAVKAMYRDIMPKDMDSISVPLVVVMGLNDDYERCGWYNDYDQQVFLASDCSRELAEVKAYEDLQTYIALYRNDPDYMVDFFVRKMNAQWNAPMYQGIAMNSNLEKWQPAVVDSLFRHGRVASLTESGMKVYQLLLYGSILFLLGVKRKEFVEIEKYALLIAVFGGFLFTLIWEAKTRYVLPYLFMQLPYMAMGIHEIMSAVEKRGGRAE